MRTVDYKVNNPAISCVEAAKLAGSEWKLLSEAQKSEYKAIADRKNEEWRE